MKVVYAKNVASKAQVNRRRFSVLHVEFGNLLGPDWRYKHCIGGKFQRNEEGDKKAKKAKKVVK